ncbi:DnaB-like helicase N-terminal domain-containing protein [Streptomyces atratus]|uniref:DnaB-like helicase N-terminal domain-containing protein n=1 Tax=Streptomyces atratus TaxID=1893 RepID=UPI0021A64CCD|nr:DnaB-like helicase N-terminal domain-containing protein [Streptomyces atratus]MCT2544301.1 AAA family ATPase [Streptomyces atratus]
MSDDDFTRVPPQDLDAEQAVLGSMLLSKDAILEVVEILTGADFYRPAHTTVFDTVCSMAVRGEPCDPITVAGQLDRDGNLARVGGATYLHTLVQAVPTAANAVYYAERLRGLSLLRGVIEAGTKVVQSGYADGDPQEIAERAVADMQAARDRGLAVRDEPLLHLDEFLDQADDEPEWVIPGVLARWDRLIVTAGEGGGKSLFLRQMAMRALSGLHPFKRARIAPVRVMIIDVENSKDQARPWIRSMAAAAREEGVTPRSENLVLEFRPGGLDLTNPADRSWLARRVEQARPDLITIGPLYKLALGNPNEEETARGLMSALEMLRTASGGAAMLIEAHSPHAAAGVKRRDLRPIGSSLWLRWPEFGFGLSPSTEVGAEALRLVDWVPWRGSRSERAWPEQFMQGATWPWQAIEFAGNAPIPSLTYTLTAEQMAALPPEQRAALDDEQQEAF